MYSHIKHFIPSTAIPAIVNHTPERIMRLFNATVNFMTAIQKHQLKICVSIYAIQFIDGMCQIPYFSRIIRAFDPLDYFFRTPQSLLGYLIETSVNAARFVWHTCDDASRFFDHEFSKPAAYELWISLSRPRSPAERRYTIPEQPFHSDREAPAGRCGLPS